MRHDHGATFDGPELDPLAAAPSRAARRHSHARWHLAWLLLTAALVGHVLDEALTDFLAVYNPTVESVRKSLPWLPLPTFTFGTWIAGLAVAILVLAALAPLTRGGGPWMRRLSRAYGGLMVLNGLGHIALSVALGRWLPGVVSSPFLLAAALFLLLSVPPRPAAEARGRSTNLVE
jgi:FtsH-binding integral membrane protein